MPIAVVLLIITIAIGAKPIIEGNLEKLKDLPVSEIDLSKIEDGTYVGKYKVYPISVEVNVIVNDHAISDIELIKHDNGKGKDAEIIPELVIEKQKLQVDVISGASYSSKVILKAIENALTN